MKESDSTICPACNWHSGKMPNWVAMTYVMANDSNGLFPQNL